MKQLWMMTLVAALAVGCGDDDDDEGDGDGAGDGDGDNGGDGYCSESGALVMCEGTTNCAFDPATIDCAMACANVKALCDSGCSGSFCTGFDEANCTTACGVTKSQACSNVTFGCYAMSSECDAVGTCIQDKQ
jgi:hypothetical protein